MDGLQNLIVYFLFALQICFPVAVGQGSDQRIGYYVSGDTTTAFYCPQSAEFYGGYLSDEYGTYAFCDYLTTDADVVRVGTACAGDQAVIYSEETIIGDETTTTSWYAGCDEYYTCTTVLLYRWYDDGYGSDLRSLIDCENWIGITTSVDSLFIESPTDVPTSTTDTETTTDSTDTDDTSTITTMEDKGAGVPDPTSSSPESAKTQDAGGDNGTDAGVIAGAVVGSVAGVALIIGGLILGFRLGRRASPQGDSEDRPKSFRDTLRSLPRPTVTWTDPQPKDGPAHDPQPVLQPAVMAADPRGEAKLNAQQSTSPMPRSDVVTPIQISPTSPGPSVWTIHAPAARAENPSVELPADPESQGWARTESHPQAYEIDSTAAPELPPKVPPKPSPKLPG